LQFESLLSIPRRACLINLQAGSKSLIPKIELPDFPLRQCSRLNIPVPEAVQQLAKIVRHRTLRHLGVRVSETGQLGFVFYLPGDVLDPSYAR
jgi:hypothetical protein